MPRTNKTVAERLWASVDKSGECWIWTGYTIKRGYGQLSVNGTKVYVHRLSWEFHNGPIPDGFYICHNCPDGDNPLCVRPEHLFLGTPKDNSQDCIVKGRRPKPRTTCRRCGGERAQGTDLALCSSCLIAKKRERYEKRRESHTAYRKANRDALAEKFREWYAKPENKERHRIAARESARRKYARLKQQRHPLPAEGGRGD